ncbi:MAG: histidinol-phosphatase [Bacteroidetes bacterium]|nr:histidinol-phosphatase [Bacteroidota bacterium]
MAKKILFIDRDGTLIIEPSSGNIDTWDKLQFYPHVFKYLNLIATEFDYELILVSNQDGLGTHLFPYSDFQPIQDFIMKSFENEDIIFDASYIDGSLKEEKSPNRKPRIGMVKQYMNNPDYDLDKSFVIGDRITDVQFAKNLGCKGIWIHNRSGLGLKELTDTEEVLRETSLALEVKPLPGVIQWQEIYEFLKQKNS